MTTASERAAYYFDNLVVATTPNEARQALQRDMQNGMLRGAPPDYLDTLLAAAGGANHVDNDGNTLLHWLLIFAHQSLETIVFFGYRLETLETLEWLIEHGADLHARNVEGETPLHLAAASEDLAAARVLIAAGADVSAPNARDQRPEDIAGLLRAFDEQFNGWNPSTLALANAAELRALRLEREQAALRQAVADAVEQPRARKRL